MSCVNHHATTETRYLSFFYKGIQTMLYFKMGESIGMKKSKLYYHKKKILSGKFDDMYDEMVKDGFNLCIFTLSHKHYEVSKEKI